MTDLHTTVDAYLAMRRALGFTLARSGGLLHDFVDHMQAQSAATITTEVALEWATLPAQASPWWWRQRLGVVRGFARYCHTVDAANEVPPCGVIRAAAPRATPHLFSQADVDAVLDAAQILNPPFRSDTYKTLIGLLAVTGMRIGEAIDLDDGDVDLDEGVVVVRDTKFAKTRELAVHPSTVEALVSYRRCRLARWPRPASDAFLVSTVGTRLHYSNVLTVFHRLTDEAGLPALHGRRPCPHDLRHSFAVRTVVAWYADGLDIGPRMATLSTYLGHTKPSDTYWYLSGSTELLGLAARRLERASEANS